MAPPVWSVGQVLTASDVNNWFVPLAAYRTSNQTLTSQATLQNDTQLFLSVAASAVYRVELGLYYMADTAADVKIGWTSPSGATIGIAMCSSLSATASTGSDDVMVGASASPTFGGIGASSPGGATYSFIFTTSSTAGTLQLQWAQGTSSATTTTVGTGSYLIAQRVG